VIGYVKKLRLKHGAHTLLYRDGLVQRQIVVEPVRIINDRTIAPPPGVIAGARLGAAVPFGAIRFGFKVSTQGFPVRYTPTADCSCFAVMPSKYTPASFAFTVL
jgi:hypothetical protein